jgi:hypothetical protein
VLVFTCYPEEQSPEQVDRFGPHSIWYVLGDSVLGPWDIAAARPFEAEPKLFAAPLVQRRDRTSAFVGFRNQEPEGIPVVRAARPHSGGVARRRGAPGPWTEVGARPTTDVALRAGRAVRNRSGSPGRVRATECACPGS